MLPAQPGTSFFSLSPAFASGDFSSSGVNPRPVFFSAPHCHAAPVQTQHNITIVPHTVSSNINDYYTSDANLWRLAAATPIFTPAQCFNTGSVFANLTTVAPPCITANSNQGCSSDRPLSARELAEVLVQSRKDYLPEWKNAQFDGNPLIWHE